MKRPVFAATRESASPGEPPSKQSSASSSQTTATLQWPRSRGVGVILDWVPAHFPRDPHDLVYFDGTHLYEHADPRQREHPDWDTPIFNYGRHEVANVLLDSALFWLDRFHADSLRVVASRATG